MGSDAVVTLVSDKESVIIVIRQQLVKLCRMIDCAMNSNVILIIRGQFLDMTVQRNAVQGQLSMVKTCFSHSG